MSQHVDLSEYYTRRQCNELFTAHVVLPDPPTHLVLGGVGLGVDQSFANIELTPPTMNGAAEIAGYEFQAVYQQGGEVHTDSFTLTVTLDNIYRLEPLGAGLWMEISARTRDTLGQVSNYSDSIDVLCASDNVPPAPPTIAGEALSDGVLVVISGGLNDEVDFAHYSLWRGRGTSGNVTWDLVPISSFYSTAVEDRSAPTSADDYWYRVQASDFSGNSSYSNVVGPFTMSATGMESPPEVDMTGAQAIPQSDGSIRLQWVPSSYPYLRDYRLWRRLTGSEPWSWELISTIRAVPGIPLPYLNYLDNDTDLGVSYDYSVTQVNSMGDESSYPDVYLTAMASDSLILPVTSLTLIGTLGGVDASWERSPSPDVTYYRVSWKLTPLSAEEGSMGVVANFAQIRGLSLPRNELANQLTVTVTAVGLFSESTPLSVTATFNDLIGYQPADDTIPFAPESISAFKNDDGSVTLSWPASISSDRSGYQVERWDSLGLSWQVIGQVQNDLPGTISFVAMGLEPYRFRQRWYRFGVRTLDYSGNISRVNLLDNSGFEDNVLLPWLAPTGVTAISSSNTMAGSQYCLLANGTSAPRQTAAVTPGDKYCFSAYVRENPATPGGRAVISLTWLDTDQVAIGLPLLSSKISSTANYQRLVVVDALAPDNATTARVSLLADPSLPVLSVYWDQTQLEQGKQESGYNNARTGLIAAIDNVAPQDYPQLGLVASSGLGQINLRWQNPPANFSGAYDYISGEFELWRKVTVSAQPDLTVDADFRKIASIPVHPDGAASGYDDLDPDEHFHITAQYKLKARDRYGNTSTYLAGGNYVEATSLDLNDVGAGGGDGRVPDAPVLVGAVANADGSVTLTWDEAATDGRNDLAGYTIFRKQQSASAFSKQASVLAANGTGTNVAGIYQYSYTDSSVSPDFTWVYSVAAFDVQLEEGPHDASGLSVLPIDTRPPAVPANLHLEGDIGRISASWDPASHAVSYVVSYTNPDAGWAYTAAIGVQSTRYYALLPNGTPAAALITNFVMRVWSVNRSGLLSSGYATGTLNTGNMGGYVAVDNAPPAAPGTPTVAYNNNGELILQWTASSSTDVSLYAVDSSFDGGIWYGVGMVSAPTTGLRLTGLQTFRETAKTYRFKVWAIDHFNNSTGSGISDSVPVQADVTAPATPATPTGFTANDPGGITSFVGVSWVPNIEGDLNHYELWYKNNSTGLGGPIMVAAGAPQWTFTGLYTSTSYSFWVIAVDNSANRSQASVWMTITTAAAGVIIGGGSVAQPYISAASFVVGAPPTMFYYWGTTLTFPVYADPSLGPYTTPNFAHFNVWVRGYTEAGVLTTLMVGNPGDSPITVDARPLLPAGRSGGGYTEIYSYDIWIQAVNTAGTVSSSSQVVTVDVGSLTVDPGPGGGGG